MILKHYFDRVVLINLKRRPDRLLQARKALRDCHWPFKQPEIFEAVDGLATPPPPHWRYGLGAWGCTQSHQKVLAAAIRDGVRQLLVLEDDVCFAEGFTKRVRGFLSTVPDDWDQLMLGGQHWNKHGKPTLIRSGIYRCTDCERTHAYGIRDEFMRILLKRWRGGGVFNGYGHCDWIMGRDPNMQLAHMVYAPEFFLIGQERSKSDVYGSLMPRKFWNPPGPEKMVINLHAPLQTVIALRKRGFFTGYSHARVRGFDRKLVRAFNETVDDPPGRIRKLCDWIKVTQWEIAADPAFVCTVWHPLASPALVRAASLWEVVEITADDEKSALRQLPSWLRSELKSDDQTPFLARFDAFRPVLRSRFDKGK